jgi:hypothetical protein
MLFRSTPAFIGNSSRRFNLAKSNILKKLFVANPLAVNHPRKLNSAGGIYGDESHPD